MTNDEHQEAAVNRRPRDRATSRSLDWRSWGANTARPTTLRTRTLLIVLTTLLGLIVVLYLPVRFLLLDSYLSIEEQDVRNNTERALNALADELSALSRTAGDYAAWDDTYDFMQSGDPSYVEINYLDETFQRNRLSLVLIIDPDKRLVFGKAFDLHANRTTPVPEQLRQLAVSESLLYHSTNDGMSSGVMKLPDGPILLASRPILSSAYTGPIRGTLIMGRRL
ncbi:MAG TPA: CHASE4 domain-containing protein, partial [Roseiflexaceae bacterium]|nr:CHASE4 domain-containing protein [Roseiflexaceae bacterium]